MKKKLTWFVSSLLVLAAMLMLPHLVFADNGLHRGWDPHPFHPPHPGNDAPGAPEIDPRLAIEGLAIAGGAVVLVWESIRRRR